MPKGYFQRQYVLWPPCRQALNAKFVAKLTSGEETLGAKEIARYFDGISLVADLGTWQSVS